QTLTNNTISIEWRHFAKFSDGVNPGFSRRPIHSKAVTHTDLTCRRRHTVKSKKVFVALLLLLSFTAFSFKCDGGSVSDPYRRAAKASDDIAASINTTIKIKRDLGTSGKISHDREVALTKLLQKANDADRAFLNEI